MELKHLLVRSIDKLEEFLELAKIRMPYKINEYKRTITPFEVLRTEKLVDTANSLEILIELVKELKDEKKELISKLDLTNELLADLAKNSKTPIKKVEKKK